MQLPRLIGGVHHPEPSREPRNRAEKRRVHGAKRYFHNRALAGAMAGRRAYQINSSLLFWGAQSLSRTPSVAGNRKTFFIGGEIRIAGLGTDRTILAVGSSANDTFQLRMNSDNTLQVFEVQGGVTVLNLKTTRVFREPSWGQFGVRIDVTTGVGKLYWNGEECTLSTSVVPSSSFNSIFNTATAHYIGRNSYAAEKYWGGPFGEVQIVDGAALTPSSFGEFDPVTLNWRPKRPSVTTWGTNGCYLGKGGWTFASLGTDQSGQGNNWTATGFLSTDVLSDSPTNIYATLNPLRPSTNASTFSNGNMTVALANSGSERVAATAYLSSGKWCWETTIDNYQNGVNVGVGKEPFATGNTASNVWSFQYTNGVASKIASGSLTSYGGALSSGSVVGHVLDVDAGTYEFFINGVSQGVAFTGLTGPLVPTVGTNGSNTVVTFNAGQKAFTYPSAYGTAKALCTSNLPATTGATSGSFTGNVSADGPCIFTGAVPETLTINGNAVTWGTHADKLSTGFKIRTASTSYNSTGTNTWVATYNAKPTVGGGTRAPALAQGNP
jgi:hypothetical protein